MHFDRTFWCTGLPWFNQNLNWFDGFLFQGGSSRDPFFISPWTGREDPEAGLGGRAAAPESAEATAERTEGCASPAHAVENGLRPPRFFDVQSDLEERCGFFDVEGGPESGIYIYINGLGELLSHPSSASLPPSKSVRTSKLHRHLPERCLAGLWTSRYSTIFQRVALLKTLQKSDGPAWQNVVYSI